MKGRSSPVQDIHVEILHAVYIAIGAAMMGIGVAVGCFVLGYLSHSRLRKFTAEFNGKGK